MLRLIRLPAFAEAVAEANDGSRGRPLAHLSDEKNGEFSMPVSASQMLSASNVAAVTAAIRRRVLPLVHD